MADAPPPVGSTPGRAADLIQRFQIEGRPVQGRLVRLVPAVDSSLALERATEGLLSEINGGGK